eukprot:10057590-Alexandrium_andersonii.AAC.1
MSASLVGSEMCIRDRASRLLRSKTPPLLRWRRMRGAAPARCRATAELTGWHPAVAEGARMTAGGNAGARNALR